MKNKIPRNFNKIIAKMNIETNMDKVGDIIHIIKNPYNDYISFNTRTKKRAIVFAEMLRDAELVNILEII